MKRLDYSLQGRFHGRRVAVVFGGMSSEREVSLRTGAAMALGLRSRDYTVIEIDAGRDLPARLIEARADVVLNALHGTYGEDGRIQGLLDWMDIPYTGDGLRACLLAMDKALSKQFFRLSGVPVAEDVVLYRGRDVADLSELSFGLPCVVKPVSEGSSVGVTIVRNAAAYGPAVKLAFEACESVLVEQFIEGPELSVATLVDQTLGSVEIEPVHAFYDYEAKYGNSGTRYHVPPRLQGDALAAVERAAFLAHQALGCRGITRTDVILGVAGPVVLEVNTLPGMTATSLVPKIAAGVGMPFGDLLEYMLDRAACGPSTEGVIHGA